MTDLNKVFEMGRITRDLDDKSYTMVGQYAKATVSIAVNRSKKQADGTWGDETSFFDVVIWGKTAENLKPYLVKGQQICVEGFLKQDRWEKDGQKFNRIYINAENVYLTGGKKEGGNSNCGMPAGVQKGFNNQPQNNGYNPAEGFSEDIPF